MKKLQDARKVLFTILLLAIVARVLVWTLLPLVPYLIVAVILVGILGIMWFRTTRF